MTHCSIKSQLPPHHDPGVDGEIHVGDLAVLGVHRPPDRRATVRVSIHDYTYCTFGVTVSGPGAEASLETQCTTDSCLSRVYIGVGKNKSVAFTVSNLDPSVKANA